MNWMRSGADPPELISQHVEDCAVLTEYDAAPVCVLPGHFTEAALATFVRRPRPAITTSHRIRPLPCVMFTASYPIDTGAFMN
jgi:hypothetical protein